ncbi:MAG: hypothetical protein LBK56_05625, partial [Gracilibacteraceae bacterium]|nr:hypothetical protein [Gracilibacteraceae bacterium]
MDKQNQMTRPRAKLLACLLTAILLLSGAPLFPAALHAAGPAPDGSSVTIAQIFPDPILADWVAQKL